MSSSVRTVPDTATPDGAARKTAVIDCDIHNELPSIDRLFPYLADHWVDYIRDVGFGGPGAPDYPPGAPTSARPKSMPMMVVPQVRIYSLCATKC